MINSQVKFKSFSELSESLPKTLEDFKKEVERQHTENSATSEAQKAEQQDRMNRYEVRFVSNRKK